MGINQQVQDRPHPIDHANNPEAKFGIIRDNIEILWNRVRKLEKKGSAVSAPYSNSLVPQVTPDPIPPSSGLLPNNFFAYDGVGEISISSAWVDITMDTEVFKESNFAHLADSEEVTILQGGSYEIVVESGIRSLNEGSVVEMKMMRYDGADWSEIEGTRAYCKI